MRRLLFDLRIVDRMVLRVLDAVSFSRRHDLWYVGVLCVFGGLSVFRGRGWRGRHGDAFVRCRARADVLFGSRERREEKSCVRENVSRVANVE